MTCANSGKTHKTARLKPVAGYVTMMWIVLAAVLVGLAQGSDFVCPEKIKDGAITLYDEHCGWWAALNFTAYIDCLKNQKLDTWESLQTCSQELNFKIVTDTFCNRNNPDAGVNNICCVITEEFKGTDRTGADKVSLSRMCLDMQIRERNMQMTQYSPANDYSEPVFRKRIQ